MGMLLLINGTVFSQNNKNTPAASILSVSHELHNTYPGLVKIDFDTAGTLNTSMFVIRRLDDYDTSHNEGFQPIDTLPYGSATTYYDYDAKANFKSESYDILTYNTVSGDQSEASTAHATMFLEISKNDSCNKRQVVRWSEYQGKPINQYQIFVNDDGITKYESTVHSQQVEFNTPFTYRAVGLGLGFISYSNPIEVETFDLIKPNPDEFYLVSLTNNSSEFIIECRIDTLADLLQHNLYREENSIFNLLDTIAKEFSEINYTVSDAISESAYKITAVNTCHVPTDSTDVFYPLVLEYKVENSTVYLNWNTSTTNSEYYTVAVNIDSEQTQNFELGFTNSFNLNLNEDQYVENEFFQFRIIGTHENFTTVSNSIEVAKSPKIKMYDAFTPNRDGINETIGPEITNASIQEFDFMVYNRFGESIFHSDSYEDAQWNGIYNGSYVSEGAYLYYVRFTTDLGKKVEKSGVIHVVYP